MKKYYVKIKYFDNSIYQFEHKTATDSLKEVENEIRKKIQKNNDMMEVMKIEYEMFPSEMSCH